MRTLNFAFAVWATALVGLVASPLATTAQEIEPNEAYGGATLVTRLIDQTGLAYYGDAPAAENLLVRLDCRSARFWLDSSMVSAWFRNMGDDSFSGPVVDLVLDGAPSPLWLTQIVGDDLTGGWIAILQFQFGESYDITMSHLAEADSVTIATPAFDIPLTPAEGDREARAAFVEACLAL